MSTAKREIERQMDQTCSVCGGWKEPKDIICENCSQLNVKIDALMPKRKSLLEGMTSEQRKQYPLTTGCIDYFRDALLKVSHVSYLGNEKHNPGQPLHWARAKSADELDALGRHLACREQMDRVGDTEVEEAAEMAWRALAFLQKMLEAKYNIQPPPGCK